MNIKTTTKPSSKVSYENIREISAMSGEKSDGKDLSNK